MKHSNFNISIVIEKKSTAPYVFFFIHNPIDILNEDLRRHRNHYYQNYMSLRLILTFCLSCSIYPYSIIIVGGYKRKEDLQFAIYSNISIYTTIEKQNYIQYTLYDGTELYEIISWLLYIGVQNLRKLVRKSSKTPK